MRMNKMMIFGAVLAAMMFAGTSFADNHGKAADKATAAAEKDKAAKKIMKEEHEKMYPQGHPEPIPGKRCFYDEKEGAYFCSF